VILSGILADQKIGRVSDGENASMRPMFATSFIRHDRVSWAEERGARWLRCAGW
jgi:hypothetical protein